MSGFVLEIPDSLEDESGSLIEFFFWNGGLQSSHRLPIDG